MIRTLLVAIALYFMSACANQALVIPANADTTVAVFGASGKIGGLIVDEALKRGYRVLGVSRTPELLAQRSALFEAVQGDLTDVESLLPIVSKVDVVFISVAGTGSGNKPETTVHAVAAKNIIQVLEEQELAPRVIQIGGATTMFGNAKAMLANMPFRAKQGSPMHAMLFGHRVALDSYLASNIDWTVLTPPTKILGWSPSRIDDGDTSLGRYRTSSTEFVIDEAGENAIYIRDLAIAAVDEVENAAYVRDRFTVGY
ncbi:MAG: NAD(P)-dependent oxidoreductase [Pseudomonadales bacterium]